MASPLPSVKYGGGKHRTESETDEYQFKERKDCDRDDPSTLDKGSVSMEVVNEYHYHIPVMVIYPPL